VPPPDFSVEPLAPHHDRAGFNCGNASLDDFIRAKARKENELGYCVVFVLTDRPGSPLIAGYYTLSSSSVSLTGIDAATRKKLPRYPDVPTALLGRLARDLRFRGDATGELLLLDALKRASRSGKQVAAYAVSVDAIDANAAAFYQRFGFSPLAGHSNRLYLPMASIDRLGLG
jgi:GNAT superfamily N-acetyltransferase